MSLEIVLVRHAIAFERDGARWRDDGQRPLSPEGKRKFRKAAAGLAQWLPKVDAVLTSPLVRTRQTAELLTDVARWPKAVDTAELAPNGSPVGVLAMLRTHREKRIALVGHEPCLSELLTLCLAGPETRPCAPMKKGGVACIMFADDIAAGKGTLTAFVPPRALREMA
jgi:phosphohistidine phosphatase